MNIALKNTAANFVSKVWGFVVLYLFSRIYINILGVELYGVISFYTLAFGIASFADVGLSSSITKEFSKEEQPSYYLGLLFLFERIYFILCLAVAIIIAIFAPQISEKWLNGASNTIPIPILTDYVRLIGLGVATQLMSSIYFGALMGRQMQVWSNGVQILTSVLKNIGVIAVMYLIQKSLYTFFLWQIIINLLFIFLLRRKILKTFSNLKVPALTIAGVSRDFWRYMGGMTLIAVLSALTIQSDKLVASKVFSLSDFGFYSLASILAQLPVLIVTPIALAIFPIFVKKYSSAQYQKGENVYRKVAFGTSLIIFPIGAVLTFYGSTIFHIWISTKNMVGVPKNIDVLITFLAIGNTFQALQYIPFYFLLSLGKTKFTIYQATAELLFLIPALYYFTNQYGLAGIGIPWMIVKIVGFIYLSVVAEKTQLQSSKLSLFKMTIVPMVVTFIVAIGVNFIVQLATPIQQLLLACFPIAILSALINIYLYDASLFKKMQSIAFYQKLFSKP